MQASQSRSSEDGSRSTPVIHHSRHLSVPFVPLTTPAPTSLRPPIPTPSTAANPVPPTTTTTTARTIREASALSNSNSKLGYDPGGPEAGTASIPRTAHRATLATLAATATTRPAPPTFTTVPSTTATRPASQPSIRASHLLT